MSKQAVS